MSNGAGTYIFTDMTSQGFIRRPLIAFDLSSIPENSRIESVTLTLHMSKTISGSKDVSLHTLLADWGEGSSKADFNEGKGVSSLAGDATWLQ